MAGPTTESLDTDLKELRDEFKELRSDFHRLEVAVVNAIATLEKSTNASIAALEKSTNASIAALEKSTNASIARVDLNQAKQEAVLSVFRTMVLGSLGAAITGILASAWTAGATSSRLTALETQVGRIENRMERIEANINRLIESRFAEPPKAAPDGK